MNVNSYFSQTQATMGNIPRSGIDRTCRHKTTFNSGDLIPVFLDQWILPGDTFTIDVNAFVRMSTPIHPVLDDAFLDINFFAIPYRLIWDDFETFMGAAKDPSEWKNPREVIPPFIDLGRPSAYGTVRKGCILDYMGIPINDDNDSNINDSLPQVSALPQRAYCLVYNDWYRAEAFDEPLYIPKDSVTRPPINPAEGESDSDLDDIVAKAYTGCTYPVKVNKFFDYFTSALPSPQRGEAVGIPVTNPFLPVGTRSETVTTEPDFNFLPLHGSHLNSGSKNILGATVDSDSDSSFLSWFSSTSSDLSEGNSAYFDNLWSKLSATNLGTINDLRIAIQIQKLLEADARGGTRYTSLIRSHFNITSPDARLQRSEFLGGKRIKIGMQQVAQTSSTDEVSPQGNLAAYSLTSDYGSYVTYSATEHCIILGLACVRTKQTYAYGLEKQWSVRDRYDVYWPELANIGELPIYNAEIYAYGHPLGPSQESGIFGYNEAFAEYRYKPNYATASFRPQYKRSLDVWTYISRYNSMPYLSSEWLKQDLSNVDQTLAVSADLEDQFIADFKFIYQMYRPMPLYSIPGQGSAI